MPVLSRVAVATVGLLASLLAPIAAASPAAPATPVARVHANTALADGIGYYNQSDRTLHLRNDATTGGSSNYAYPFGPADRSVPIVVFSGDWDGDGIDGVGYYNRADGTFHLRNDATRPGRSDYAFTFGPVAPDQVLPVVGDWNHTGREGIGYIQSGIAHLRNDATRPGGSNYLVHYQGPVGQPFSGDWDGDGKAGLGYINFYACGAVCAGDPSVTLYAREPAITTVDDQPIFFVQSPTPYFIPTVVAGDWNGDGEDGLAIFFDPDGRMWLFNNVHGTGSNPDYSYPVSNAGLFPRTLVAGRWR
jgi:endoglucanase